MATRPSRRQRLKLGRRDRDADRRRRAPRRAAPTAASPHGAGRPPLYADSRLEDLVVITGYSGAGKSTAMAVFEDAGYFCVDNLPPEMIRALVELFVHEGSKVERAAVVSDVRGGDYFEALPRRPRRPRRARACATACCSSTPTSRRCSPATRRPAGAIPLAPGVERRRRASRPSARCSRRSRSAPTSSSTRPACKAHMLRRKIADEFLPRAPRDPPRGHARELRLQARARRATPTSSSTSASCPTRTTSPSCGR